jgi:hypothetical protein
MRCLAAEKTGEGGRGQSELRHFSVSSASPFLNILDETKITQFRLEARLAVALRLNNR